MHWIRRALYLSALLGIPLACALSVGCQTAPRQNTAPTGAVSPGNEPPSAIAQSDAQRAEKAIERDSQDRAGERRPVDRRDQRVVDQPPVGNRK
jgi:hypothetical protein